MLISLACDNRKFLVYRDGSVSFNEYDRADDPPGTSDGVHTWVDQRRPMAICAEFRRRQPLSITRHLDGGWLPMPVTTVKDKNVDVSADDLRCPG